MGLARRPREVYRTFSEEELLEGDTGLYEQPGDPAAEQPGDPAAPKDPLSGPAKVRPSGTVAARSRAFLLTVLATFLGLAVGLAAVTLLDGGGLPNLGGATPGARRLGPETTAGRGLPALPIDHGARARRHADARRAPRAPRVALAATRRPLRHVASRNPLEASPAAGVGDQGPPTSAPAPSVGAAPASVPAPSGLSLVAREAGSEFGFER